ncbi:MAG: hypothetical protein JWN56_1900 [Sphingobacteriales bacterium]|nr:hypothetical protein [Sphingobacteriales bacterium]
MNFIADSNRMIILQRGYFRLWIDIWKLYMISSQLEYNVSPRQKKELLKKVAWIIDNRSLTGLHVILLFEAVNIDCRLASEVFSGIL